MKLIHKIFWLYTILIPFLAVLPINGSNSRLNSTYIIFVRLDYLAHVGIFILWIVLYKWAYFSVKNKFRGNGAFRLSLLFLLFAILSEVIQSFIPYRSFNINDLIANLLGVAIGLIILFAKHGNISKTLATDHKD
jgi:VanZ family protein